MTRKDYKLIAYCIAQIDDNDARLQALKVFTTELQSENPRFDKEKFMNAILGMRNLILRQREIFLVNRQREIDKEIISMERE